MAVIKGFDFFLVCNIFKTNGIVIFFHFLCLIFILKNFQTKENKNVTGLKLLSQKENNSSNYKSGLTI